MSLGVKLDTLRGPGAPGEKLARVIFRGELSYFLPYIISVWLIEKLAGSMKNYGNQKKGTNVCSCIARILGIVLSVLQLL